MYCRYVHNIYIFYRFNKSHTKELMQNFLTEISDPNNENVVLKSLVFEFDCHYRYVCYIAYVMAYRFIWRCSGCNVDGSTVKALSMRKTMLTVLTKITTTIAELEKRHELKAKLKKIQIKLKESGLKQKFFKGKAKVTNDVKGLKDDLKTGDTRNVESTVQFIQLASKTGQNTIQSITTVLIQRMSEYEAKQGAPAKVGDESKEQARADQKKVDSNVMQGAS